MFFDHPYVTFVYGGYFTGDDGWLHPERTENTYELMVVTSSTVYMAVEDAGEFAVQKGQALLLVPQVRHWGTRHSDGVSFYWFHFTVNGQELPFTKRYFPRFSDTYLCKELLHDAFLPSAEPYLVSTALLRILALLKHLSDSDNHPRDKTAEDIYEWMRVHTDAHLTLRDVAKKFGYSADHVSRLLVKNFGVTGKNALNSFLLSKAKELLVNTEKYVSEIAYELGFDGAGAFVGFFKYHEGIPPGVFRDKYYCTHTNRK